MSKPTEKTHQLPFKLLCEVCSTILDSGYYKSPEEYVREYYKKEFYELTIAEAEYIVKFLKPGCLYEGDPKDLEPVPIPKEVFYGEENSQPI